MDKFDQVKNYIKFETDRLNLEPFISKKYDFYGIKTDKKEKQKEATNNASNISRECVSVEKIPDSYKNVILTNLLYPISNRLLNCLHRASVFTVGDFLKLNNNDLSRIWQLGKTTLKEAIMLRQKLMSEENMKEYMAYSEDQKKVDDSAVKKLTVLEIRDFAPLINVDHYNFDYTEQDLVRYTEFNSNIRNMLIEHLNQINKSHYQNRNNEMFMKRIGLQTGEEKTLEEVSIDYDVTRERVRQIVKKTINRLKKYKNDYIQLFNLLDEKDIMNYFADGMELGDNKRSIYLETIFSIINKKELSSEILKCCQKIRKKKEDLKTQYN